MTSPYSLFRTMNKCSDTDKDVIIDNIQDAIEEDFDSSPSFFYVLINDNITQRESQIVYKKNLTKDNAPNEKRIIMKPNTVSLDNGDLIYVVDWDDYWILTDLEPSDDIYSSGMIQKCNSLLKWKDEYGVEYSHPCIIEKNTKTELGIDNMKLADIVSSKYRCIVRLDSDSNTLSRNMRFLFGSSLYNKYQAYRCTDIRSFDNPNVLTIMLEEDELDSVNDDIINGFANNDYENYSLTISNDVLSMSISNTADLDVILLKGGAISTDSITYSSSDTGIATVSVTGEVIGIANGACVITASLTTNTNINDTASVTVEAVTSNNYEIIITGDNELFIGDTDAYKNSYVISKTNNGVVVADTFSVAILSGSDYCTLEIIDNNNFKLQGDSTGTSVIRVTDSGLSTQDITINIQNMF